GHQPGLDQLEDELLAHPVDVQGLAGDGVADRLQLSALPAAYAPPPLLCGVDGRAAARALAGEADRRLVAGAELDDGGLDARDDVARLVDGDMVADPQAAAGDVGDIVQGGVGDGGA